MIVNVNVYPVEKCLAFTVYKSGYIAIADIEVCWAHGETIDGAINEFKKAYRDFSENEKIEFDFHVKLS